MRNVMIDVLRGVSLVVHQKAALPKADVLDQNCVARQICLTLVGYLEMPQPNVAPADGAKA